MKLMKKELLIGTSVLSIFSVALKEGTVSLLYQRKYRAAESKVQVAAPIISDLFGQDGLTIVKHADSLTLLIDGAKGEVRLSFHTGFVTPHAGVLVHDIDNDVTQEVLSAGSDGVLYIFDPYKKTKRSLTTIVGGIIWEIAVADVTGDGIADLQVISFDRLITTSYFHMIDGKAARTLWKKERQRTKSGDIIRRALVLQAKKDRPLLLMAEYNELNCYDALTGAKMWSHNFGERSFFGMNLARRPNGLSVIEHGQEEAELVVGTSAGGVFVFSADGKKLREADIGGSPLGNAGFVAYISTGDLTGDGYPDFVISSIDHNVYALDGRTMKKLWEYKTGHEVQSSPALADLNNDGVLDVVVVPRDSYVYCISGKDGKLLWKYTLPEQSQEASAVIADVNRDGRVDVVVNSHYGTLTVLTTGARCEPGAILWGRLYGNNQGTAQYGVR